MPNTDTQLITTKQAAELSGSNIRQIIRLVERGDLHPFQKLPGSTGAYIFLRRDIELLRKVS